MTIKRKVLLGSASNIVRMGLSMLVSLVLPPFLVHRLAPAEYSAWVLILQISTYVSLVDLGLQTAIGKFVAEHEAAADREANHHLVSTAFTLLSGTAALAALGIFVVSRFVPELFRQMPAHLVPEVRVGVMAVGFSTAFALPFSTFSAIFTGLQDYAFPTIVAIAVRVLSAASLILALLMHGGLVQMAWIMAAFNVASGIAQFFGWRWYASSPVDFSFFHFHRSSAVRLAKYGSVISLWTVAMLLISGLDTVIVGHYDYKDTGFYGIASSVTNVMLALVTSLFGPLLPAISGMQAGSTPERIGGLVVRTSRYCTLLLASMGLPLVLGAYPLLNLWVRRPDYAAHCTPYLQVLVIGNVIRQLAYAYVIAVVATGKQHLATVSAIAEASVNLGLSLWLVQRWGAIGVAFGTLFGAVVSVSVHVLVSMHYTRPAILFPRSRFLLQGVLRPLLIVVPSLCVLPFWSSFALWPAPPLMLLAWLAATLAIAWMVALSGEDRVALTTAAGRLVRRNISVS